MKVLLHLASRSLTSASGFLRNRPLVPFVASPGFLFCVSLRGVASIDSLAHTTAKLEAMCAQKLRLALPKSTTSVVPDTPPKRDVSTEELADFCQFNKIHSAGPPYTLQMAAEFITQRMKESMQRGATAATSSCSFGNSTPTFIVSICVDGCSLDIYSIRESRYVTLKASLIKDVMDTALKIARSCGGGTTAVFLALDEKHSSTVNTFLTALRTEVGFYAMYGGTVVNLVYDLLGDYTPGLQLGLQTTGKGMTDASVLRTAASILQIDGDPNCHVSSHFAWRVLRQCVRYDGVLLPPWLFVSSLLCPVMKLCFAHITEVGKSSASATFLINNGVYQTTTSPDNLHEWIAKNILRDDCITMLTSTSYRALAARAIRRAMRISGRKCIIITAKDVDSSLKTPFPNAASMEKELCKNLHVPKDELLKIVSLAAGTEERKRMRERAKPPPPGASFDTSPAAEKWVAAIYDDPKRKKLEKDASTSVRRFMAVSLIATRNNDYRRTANPTSARNYIVAAAFTDYTGARMLPLQKLTSRSMFSFPSLADVDVLVLHGAKNSLLLCWDDPELQAFLQRGGRVWCTADVEYLLSAFRRRSTTSLHLETIHLLYACREPTEGVDSRVDFGLDPGSASLDDCRRILDTQLDMLVDVFHGQVRTAVAQSQMISIRERQDRHLFFAYMENNGIKVNCHDALEMYLKQQNQLSATDRALRLYLPQSIPLDNLNAFSFSSPIHVKSLLLGGTVSLLRKRVPPRGVSSDLLGLMLKGKYDMVACRHPVVEGYLKQYLSFVGESTPKYRLQARKHFEERKMRGEAATTYRIFVFDLEMTGLDFETDEIVEMCFIDVKTQQKFSTLVRPRQPIPNETTEIHNITSAMVQNERAFAEIAPSLVSFLHLDAQQQGQPKEHIILVAHNSSRADEPVLRRALEQCGVAYDKPRLSFCDSVTLFKWQSPKLTSYTLADLAVTYGVSRDDNVHHRASDDAERLLDCLKCVANCVKGTPFVQHEALLRLMGSSLCADETSHCFALRDVDNIEGEWTLPSHIHTVIHNANLLSTVSSALSANPFDAAALKTLAAAGSKVAQLLLTRKQVESVLAVFVELGGNGHSLTSIHADGFIRQEVGLNAVCTGRTTSMSPCCQSFPKNSDIRSIFVSQYGDDGCLVEVDEKQLEVNVAAALCQDETLIEQLAHGVDFHLLRTLLFFPELDYPEICRLYRAGDPKVKEARQKAKHISFQRLYGAGANKISEHNQLAIEDVRKMIQWEEKTFPGLAKHSELVLKVLRRELNPGRPACCIFELPTGTRLAFRHEDIGRRQPAVKNYPIQAFAAELVHFALGKLFRELLANPGLMKKMTVTNFVHDSVWLDCHKSVVDDAVRLVTRVMEGIPKQIQEMYGNLIDLKVAFPVSVDIGKNLGEMTPYHEYAAAKKSSTGKLDATTVTVASADSTLISQDDALFKKFKK